MRRDTADNFDSIKLDELGNNEELSELDGNAPNYYEYTAFKLLAKKLSSVVDEIRKGDSSKGIHGTNGVLSLYSSHVKEANIKALSLDEVSEIEEGSIALLKGGYNVFHTHGEYFIFKDSRRFDLEKKDKNELSKFIKKYQNIDLSEICKIEEEEDREKLMSLANGGLLKRVAYSKSDFVELCYKEIKDPKFSDKYQAFIDNFGEKPTKKHLNEFELSDLYYKFEVILETGILEPYFENGYSVGETSYQVRMSSRLDDSILQKHSNMFRGSYKELILESVQSLSHAEDKLEELNAKELDLNVFVEKQLLKKEIADVVKEIDEILENTKENAFNYYYTANNKFGYHTFIEKSEIVCEESTLDELKKFSLVDSYEINRIQKNDDTPFTALGVELSEVSTISDYGSKNDLKSVLLYVESLDEIISNESKEKKKVKEFEKNKTQRFGL